MIRIANILILLFIIFYQVGIAQTYVNLPEDGSVYHYMIDYYPAIEPIDPMERDYNLLGMLSPCYKSVTYKITPSGKTLTKKSLDSDTHYKLYNSKYCIDRYQGQDLHGYSSKVGMKYKNLFCDKVQNLSTSKQTYMGSAFNMNYHKVSMSENLDINTDFDEILLYGRHDKSYAPVGVKFITMPGWSGEAMMFKVKEEFTFSKVQFLLEGETKTVLQGLELENIFPDIKTEQFQFYNPEINDMLLKLILKPKGNGEIQKAAFLLNQSADNFIQCESIDMQNIYLFPNPTIGNVKLLFQNYEPGEYELDIFNTIGKKLSSISITLPQEEDQISISLPRLRKGTYLYAVQNKNGERLVTRRLSIITY